MVVKTDEMTVGNLREQIEGLPDDLPLLIYDENGERYQDVYKAEKLTYKHEERHDILPPARKGELPLLEENTEFLLLTGWSAK
jgi:hypothetical protein